MCRQHVGENKLEIVLDSTIMRTAQIQLMKLAWEFCEFVLSVVVASPLPHIRRWSGYGPEIGTSPSSSPRIADFQIPSRVVWKLDHYVIPIVVLPLAILSQSSWTFFYTRIVAASHIISSIMANSKAHDLDCLTIKELEKLAAERMDKQTRDYYNEGADSGSTLAENISAYQKYRIRPRVLRDISAIDTSVSIFGHENTVPLGVAPTAMQGLAHSEGELATARACKEMGIVMGLSSFSTTSLEDVKDALGPNTPGALQLYLFEDREESKRLIQRAKEAGYSAVFLTVDTPVLGRRNLEIRNQFTLPKHLKVANFNRDGSGEKTAEGMDRDTEANQARKRSKKDISSKRTPPTGPITFHTHAPNPTLNWERDIAWLKEQCYPEMQVWVKGIATGEDALLACQYGVDGIVVSNHGGRQLNGALATIDALPDVVEAVRSHSKKIPVHVDGGIRHGTDVFKALALGADFVWIGRPVLWGLAYKGQEGVELCLKLLSDEIRLCMGLAGVTRVEDISKEYLVKMDRSGFVSKL
jgi:(S)-2-hydroxy-acid oxidase